MEIKVKFLTAGLEKLEYKSPEAAAFDLRASGTFVVNLDEQQLEVTKERYILRPAERILVKTGVALAIPPGHWGLIKDRSGLAMKQGIHTLGGVIDSDYRGEIGVVLINLGTRDLPIYKNDRIAQMIILPCVRASFHTVDELPTSDRGVSGFGASGMR